MSERVAVVSLAGDGLRLVALTGSGHHIVLDDAAGDSGPRPAELVPVAIAACTAMDVIYILRKKRQVVTSYSVESVGTQRDEAAPHVFTKIEITHVVAGPDLDAQAVRRAIELSATRYCSVGATLASGIVEIRHRYIVRSDRGEEAGEVVIIGPDGDVDALERRMLVGAS
jgi:putative redox protein